MSPGRGWSRRRRHDGARDTRAVVAGLLLALLGLAGCAALLTGPRDPGVPVWVHLCLVAVVVILGLFVLAHGLGARGDAPLFALVAVLAVDFAAVATWATFHESRGYGCVALPLGAFVLAMAGNGVRALWRRWRGRPGPSVSRQEPP